MLTAYRIFKMSSPFDRTMSFLKKEYTENGALTSELTYVKKVSWLMGRQRGTLSSIFGGEASLAPILSAGASACDVR